MNNSVNKSQPKNELTMILPVILALCIIPLIVLTKDYTTDFTMFDWFNTTAIDQIDSFEYSKGVMVIFFGVIAALIVAVSQYIAVTKKQPFLQNADKKVSVIWGVEVVFIIVSALFSKYQELAMHGGGYGQWQTMWVLLGYCMLFMNAYLFVNSDRCVLVLMKCMIFSAGYMALLGTLQSCGNNPLSWDWVQEIITSRSNAAGISFKEGISSVVMTFSNPNYVGVYVALVFPIVVAFVFAKVSENKTAAIAYRIFGGLVAVGLIKTLFGAGSSAGAITVLVAIPIALIFIISGFFTKKQAATDESPASEATSKESSEIQDSSNTEPATDNKISKNKKTNVKAMVIGAAIVLVVVVGGFAATKSTFVENTVNKILQGGTDTRNVLCISNQDDNRLRVTLRNETVFYLSASVNASQGVDITATKEDGTPLGVTFDAAQNMYTLDDEQLKMLTLAPTNFNNDGTIYTGFKFTDVPNDISWSFMNVDGKWKYYSPFGKFVTLREIEHFGFKNTENIANRRGYIWSRTIPLMKQYWLKGVGPNAFIIAFPNDDFVGSKRVGGSTTLVDKPHNTFFQIFIQLGGVAAVAYVALWLLYVIGSIRLFWRRKCKTPVEIIGLGLMVGIICHAIAGLTNDSVIGVQNVYWILLGTGYAVNRIIVMDEERKRQEELMRQKRIEQNELRKKNRQSKGKQNQQSRGK